MRGARRGGTEPAPTSGAGDAYPVFGLPPKVEEVLELVDRIPLGLVLTYGDVGELVGDRGARFVGNVLSRYGSDVPWWRVIRAGGWPPRGLEDQALEHYREEGTSLLESSPGRLRVDLQRARWDGRTR